MDIETANRELPVRQATDADLERVFTEGFGTSLTLARNYGDRLEAVAAGDAGYRLAYYDAGSGRRFEAAESVNLAELREAFFDYLQGHWNWHGCRAWKCRSD